jgi:hypothetical protein
MPYGQCAGTMEASGHDELTLNFDRFWVDVGADNLRPDSPTTDSRAQAAWGLGDQAITTLGRAAFFPQFARFPVLYLDQDIAGAQVIQLRCTLFDSRQAPCPL